MGAILDILLKILKNFNFYKVIKSLYEKWKKRRRELTDCEAKLQIERERNEQDNKKSKEFRDAVLKLADASVTTTNENNSKKWKNIKKLYWKDGDKEFSIEFHQNEIVANNDQKNFKEEVGQDGR